MQDTEGMQKLKVMKPISPSEIVWKLWWKGLVRKRKTIFLEQLPHLLAMPVHEGHGQGCFPRCSLAVLCMQL